MGIKHEDVKASGDKGLASEWNKNHVVDDDIDMVQKQLLNNVIENRTDFPAGPVEGQAIYRTDENKFYIWNGATWDDHTSKAVSQATATADTNTSSTTFVNIAGLSVSHTSKTGKVLVMLNIVFNATISNTTGSFRIAKDGVGVNMSEKRAIWSSGDGGICVATTCIDLSATTNTWTAQWLNEWAENIWTGYGGLDRRTLIVMDI